METPKEVLTGTICAWIPQRGWGFVSRILNEGKPFEKVEKYWFHVRSLVNRSEDPQVGMRVSFTVSGVRGGKYPAIENITLL
jgi:hypothetical protein